jgi:hypothetical protein
VRNQREQRRAEALHHDLLENHIELCVLALVTELARQAGVFNRIEGAIQP